MNQNKKLSNKPLTILFNMQDGAPVSGDWILARIDEDTFQECLEKGLIEELPKNSSDPKFCITELGIKKCQA